MSAIRSPMMRRSQVNRADISDNFVDEAVASARDANEPYATKERIFKISEASRKRGVGEERQRETERHGSLRTR